MKVMTSAESHWCNGINGRLNAIIDNLLNKIVADTQYDLEFTLACIVPASNELINTFGFS